MIFFMKMATNFAHQILRVVKSYLIKKIGSAFSLFFP